ncbi:MAG: IclR family transcriptional regulator [Deltaproteobacteria bacterium]|nr:IclR family transcriptional regulator [Deltaproteobacteria bacterium]
MTTKNYTVHSLERGLDLLEIMAEDPVEKTLTEISQAAGFNSATTHRILHALKARGYVHQNPKTSEYGLTMKLFLLGHKLVTKVGLRELAAPVLRKIAETTGETTFLYVKDGDEALCLDRYSGRNAHKLFFHDVGDRLPLHIGGSPRVLLAYQSAEIIERILNSETILHRTKWTPGSDVAELKESLNKIRERGYAVFEYEEAGAKALAVPVFNMQRQIVASIGIFSPSERLSEERIVELVKTLKDEVLDVSTKQTQIK